MEAKTRLLIDLILVGLVCVMGIALIFRRPVDPVEVVKPVIIDYTDTIRIETIKTFINNTQHYTHEREIIYAADSTRLDSVLDAQLREISRRGW